MKRSIIIITALTLLAPCAVAQQVEGVSVNDVRTEHSGDRLTVSMALNLAELAVSSNRAVLLTPWLVNGADSVELRSVGVYGRSRHYHYTRNGESMLTGSREMVFRAKNKPDTLLYNDATAYQTWMDGAELRLRRADYGCCGSVLAEQTADIGSYNEPQKPAPVAPAPKPEQSRIRSVEGSAFIAFPVNKTDIRPDYRGNTAELGKIRATIDSVLSDRNIAITAIELKGYASPEGSYSHNGMLAKNRTEALKSYICRLYHFDNVEITCDYEAEDWAGLRRYVENSNLENRSGILAIIDSNADADEKEAQIKKTYPQDYRHLLDSCYPTLRHTDYKISYTVLEKAGQ